MAKVVIFEIILIFCLLNDVLSFDNQVEYVIDNLKHNNPYPSLSHSLKDDDLLKRFSHFLIKSFNSSSQDSPLLSGVLPPFNCQLQQRSQSPPTNVNEVRFADIDVVMALGDSITAGFGAKAKTIFGLFTDYRGVSWSIGGIQDVQTSLTLANMFRFFNPNLVGFSIGSGSSDSSNAVLNQAITGAVTNDVPSQARTLVERMHEMNFDYENTWKVLTVFIGANDLCDWCDDKSSFGSTNYFTKLEESLDYLQSVVPRLIVNVVPPIDVTELSQLSSGFCSLLHPFECSCAVASSSVRQEVSAEAAKFAVEASRIAQLDKYNQDPDFTVVMQPFMTKTHVPTKDGSPDMDYFAPDCFHFSELAHQAAAIGLWNNMVQSVGEKETSWHGPAEAILCPSANQFIPTNQNK